jgi:hypothetical protein
MNQFLLAVWNQLQRTSSKVQEKNVKKRESANQGKGTFGSNTTWNGTGSQQSSGVLKTPQRHQHYPPPISKPNYVEDNIDMIKNKENFYHRYPARKYENAYSRRKDSHGGSEHEKHERDLNEESEIQSSNNHQRQSSLPVTVNLNHGEHSQNGSLPTTVTIPLGELIRLVLF